MAYIMRHSESSAVVLQDPETLDKLLPILSAPAKPSNGSGKVHARTMHRARHPETAYAACSEGLTRHLDEPPLILLTASA